MRASLQVLFVTPEITPWVKTGGLGDVSAALPVALGHVGADVRVLVPGFGSILDAVPLEHTGLTLPPPIGASSPVRLLASRPDDNVSLLVLDCADFYCRPGSPYQDTDGHDWPDNYRRFGLLGRVAAMIAGGALPNWSPQIVHCHDWQAGLAPAFMHFGGQRRAASVMTVHNLAFQGVFPQHILPELGLPFESYHPDGLEFYGNASFMKAGLFYADRVTTVSPRYAVEIQQEALGFGMHGLLHHRSDHLTGILNGIDTTVWDPNRDPYLPHMYGLGDLEGKARCKAALQRRLGLPVKPEAPLLGMVSRITHQKGSDMLAAIAEPIAMLGAQLVILGNGDAALQQMLANAAQHYPDAVRLTVGYDESLAHQIEAGADMFLMPSRFEPCGLNQMYSLRYGTPPIVHETGGLADTVVDCNLNTLASGTANGFVFRDANPESFLATIRRAIAAWHDQRTWRTLQRNGMSADFTWDHAAERYMQVYGAALGSLHSVAAA